RLAIEHVFERYHRLEQRQVVGEDQPKIEFLHSFNKLRLIANDCMRMKERASLRRQALLEFGDSGTGRVAEVMDMQTLIADRPHMRRERIAHGVLRVRQKGR